jgi:hypothetical protein
LRSARRRHDADSWHDPLGRNFERHSRDRVEHRTAGGLRRHDDSAAAQPLIVLIASGLLRRVVVDGLLNRR